MWEEIGDREVEIFLLLADAVIHETSAENIRPYVDKDFPPEKIDEYVKSVTKPSDIPEFATTIRRIINGNTVDTCRTFSFLCFVLDLKVMAPTLTNSLTLVRDMTIQQREDLLRNWRDSPISLKRRVYKLFYSFTVSTFLKLAPEIHFEAMGYPGRDVREKLYDNQEIDPFKYTMLAPPTSDELYLPDVDVVIVGSGSGAGVTAHTLANEGYKVLVLEKGKYYSNSELSFSEKDGMSNLYEGTGTIATTDQSVFILAGATFGGGSTVNWSACLKTPFKVRKEWYDDYGMEWAASDLYDLCIQYVWEHMGASLDGVEHSWSNQVLLDGAAELGYKSNAIAQNSGHHPNHDCGFCYLGCKYGIKQGSANCWFKDAAAKGCQFMDQVRVHAILHRKGKAYGLSCEDTRTGHKFTIRGPKKFVSSCGSLHTPVLLQKSGFKNKHIGANLKLHPVTVVLGDFEKKTEPHNHPIMTSLCTHSDDLDGKAHGPKIETILHAPSIEMVFLPWKSSEETRRNILKYNNLSALLVITRDEGSGTVTYDKARPNALVVDYTVSKYDRDALLEGSLTASDILYIQGAKEIIVSSDSVESFKSSKPKHQRTITDKDYVAWRKYAGSKRFNLEGTSYGSAHQMASCRITGKGPKYGAADLSGRLFECKNVYVADASAMPTASGANPMISTMAIARKIALDIANDLRPQARL